MGVQAPARRPSVQPHTCSYTAVSTIPSTSLPAGQHALVHASVPARIRHPICKLLTRPTPDMNAIKSSKHCGGMQAPARRPSVQPSLAEAQQQRQAAAQHAQREVERLRLDEERRRLEGVRAAL